MPWVDEAVRLLERAVVAARRRRRVRLGLGLATLTVLAALAVLGAMLVAAA